MSGESTLIIQPGIATILAAFVGFLSGTIINHLLVQRRATRARKDEIIYLCQGLIAEISVFRTKIEQFVGGDDEVMDREGAEFLLEQVTQNNLDFYKANISKFGMLGWEAFETLQFTYSDFTSLKLLADKAYRGQEDHYKELFNVAERIDRETNYIEDQLWQVQVQHLTNKDYKIFRKQELERIESLKENKSEKYERVKKQFEETYTRKLVF